MAQNKPEPIFMGGCINSVVEMRRHGMNDILIACVLSEVRASAIQEERLRLEFLRHTNPPKHLPAQDYLESIREIK